MDVSPHTYRKKPENVLTCSICGQWPTVHAFPCQHVSCDGCADFNRISESESQARSPNCPLCYSPVFQAAPRRTSIGETAKKQIERWTRGQNNRITVKLKVTSTPDQKSVKDHLRATPESPRSTGNAYYLGNLGSPKSGTNPNRLTSPKSEGSPESPTSKRNTHSSAYTESPEGNAQYLDNPGRNAQYLDNPGRNVNHSANPELPTSDLDDEVRMTVTFKASFMGILDLPWDASGLCCMDNSHVIMCQWGGNNVHAYRPNTENSPEPLFRRLATKWDIPSSVRAWGVACNRKYMFVSDYEDGKVLQYSFGGTLVNTIPVGFTGDAGLCLHKDTLYVTSSSTNTVFAVEVRVDKAAVRTFVDSKTAPDMSKPHYVAANDTRVAVSCWGSLDVQVFDKKGNQLYKYGTGVQGYDPGQLDYPRGVALDRDNRLFIVDCWNDRIVVVSDTGTLLGCIDLTWDQLQLPSSLAVDDQGNMIVSCRQPRALAVYRIHNEE